ncbi:MAG: hypothetical protein H7343_21820 [Undibacterium sp.]|nr:hypothetical protein [Opitutaceae bacterium]
MSPNPPFPHDDFGAENDVDALLREASAAPLSDDGFLARVLRVLPEPEKAVRGATAARRSVLCSVALAAGLVLGLAQKDETTWAPLVAWAGKLASEQSWEMLLRFDSPWWITVLALGGTYVILKYLERPVRV